MNDVADREGWVATVAEFLETTPEIIVTTLVARCNGGFSQQRAWISSIAQLKEALSNLVAQRHEAAEWYLVFEYELPREGGRRPDVCILTGTNLLVLEFKDAAVHPAASVDQCDAYVRDFREYHLVSRNMNVSGCVVSSSLSATTVTRAGVRVTGPSGLMEVLLQLPSDAPTHQQAVEWLRSAYRPLPALIDAARRIFASEEFPQIRRAASSGIPQALAKIREVAERAEREGEKHLVLLSGSPGSGKTLVGLQFVHDFSSASDVGRRATFLSGNAPLVEVLQYALRSKVFVQDVHRFLLEYGYRSKLPPDELVLIFDEAQRAWDRDRMVEWYAKKRQLTVDCSEPSLFVRIASRRSGGTVLLGLVGHGQEIHVGEESGIAQWHDAILKDDSKWTVHCAPTIAHHFVAAQTFAHDDLNLTLSLRSHAAESLHEWVNSILEGRLESAGLLAEALAKDHFFLHVTDDLEVAKEYLRRRYADEPTKTYGIIASSKSKNLVNYGLNTGWKSPEVASLGRMGPWFFGRDGAEPSCRKLAQAATEFSCQGLELDGALIAWGSDLTWDGTSWKSPQAGATAKARNPHQLRLNSYRVLLTRGRDGMVVYCPRGSEMRSTMSALETAGFRRLSHSPPISLGSE